MKWVEKIRINAGKTREREIRFLNIPIVQYGKKEEKGVQERYLDILPKNSFSTTFLDNIMQYNNEKYDDIYIIRTGSGECYLLMYFIQEWCKINKSKNPLIICNKKYHQEMFQMWNPQYKTYFMSINVAIFDLLFKKIKSKYRQHNVYTYLPRTFFEKCNREITKAKKYNLDYILESLKILPSALKPLKEYAGDVNFPQIDTLLDNFILITPEAFSCENLEDDFCYKLISKLKQKGYNVIINSSKYSQYKNFAPTTYFNFKSLYLLAKRAKYIITVRSGLSEFLSTCNTPQFVIVTSLPNYELSSNDICSCYDLNKLPFNTQKIYQYDKCKWDNETLINDILVHVK